MLSSSGGGAGAAAEELLIRDSTPESLLPPSSLGGERSKAPQLKKSEDTVKQETNDESIAEMYTHERSQSNSKETDTDSEKHTNAALDVNMPADFLTKWIPVSKLDLSVVYATGAHN